MQIRRVGRVIDPTEVQRHSLEYRDLRYLKKCTLESDTHDMPRRVDDPTYSLRRGIKNCSRRERVVFLRG